MRVLQQVGRWLLFRLTAVFIAFALLCFVGAVIGFAEADSIGDGVSAAAAVVLAGVLGFLGVWSWRARQRSLGRRAPR